MSNHTPGPWALDLENDGDVQANGFEICSVFGGHEAGEEWVLKGRFPSREEGEANACLIAAAPDLLEALQLLLSSSQDFQTGIAEAEAAIAKATGAKS